MNSHLPDISGLSKECDDLLMRRDMFATINPDGDRSDIHSVDGDYMTSVTTYIHPDDLQTLLDYGQRMFNRGSAAGERAIKHRFRALLDLAEAPTT